MNEKQRSGQYDSHDKKQNKPSYRDVFWKNPEVPKKDKLQMSASILLAGCGIGQIGASLLTDNDILIYSGYGTSIVGIFGTQIVNHRAMRREASKTFIKEASDRKQKPKEK